MMVLLILHHLALMFVFINPRMKHAFKPKISPSVYFVKVKVLWLSVEVLKVISSTISS